jgi:hypothetical protein
MPIRYHVNIVPEGELVKLSVSGLQSRPAADSTRGEVRGFSQASHNRLMFLISSMKKHDMPLFVTLTYREFSNNFEEYKYHLHHFFVRLRRAFPKFGAIWKLEYQSRGAAHYHLLLWGVDYEDVLEWIPKNWNEIVQGDAVHLAFHRGELDNQHCVTPVRSWHGVKTYAAKYLGKIDDRYQTHTGRIWGKRGALPYGKRFTFKVDYHTYMAFRAAFLGYQGRDHTRQSLGLWGFAGNVADWIVYLEQLTREHEALSNPPPLWADDWRDMEPPQDDYIFLD